MLIIDKKNVKVIAIKAVIIFVAAILMGFSCAMNLFSELGADPLSFALEAVGNTVGVKAGTMNIIFSVLVVGIFFFVDRRNINLATLILMVSLGLGMNWGLSILGAMFPNGIAMWLKVVLAVVGPIFTGVTVAMYLACDMGASPLDILNLYTCKLIKKSFKWGTYVVYAILFVVGLIFKGNYGLGTVTSLVFIGTVADFLIPRFRKVINKALGVEAGQ